MTPTREFVVWFNERDKMIEVSERRHVLEWVSDPVIAEKVRAIIETVSQPRFLGMPMARDPSPGARALPNGTMSPTLFARLLQEALRCDFPEESIDVSVAPADQSTL